MNYNQKLSNNFYLSEFVNSQTASRMNIPNIPDENAISNLKLLCQKVLQPTRDYFGKPVIISSGFRCQKLNQLIGGSKISQHILGEAADFEIYGIPNYDVAQWIHKNLNYDQLILEFYSGGNSGWIHSSYSKNRMRNQELTINRNGTFNGLKKY